VISVSPRARRGASYPDRRPVTQDAHHRATPVCAGPPGPGYCSCRMLLSHAPVASRPSRPRHRLTRLISRPAPKSHLSPTSSRTRQHPTSPAPARRPAPLSRSPLGRAPSRPSRPPQPAQTERNRRIRGKPFLTASNALADYSESPTARTSWERIEGVSRSLPFSDLLALTSSHMFFSVMN